MNKQQQRSSMNRGDASIVFTFVVLMIVMMSAFTISVISVSTIKGARSGENSALALYAADTGLERGMSEYWWGNGDCSSNNPNVQIPVTVGSRTISYSLVIDNIGDGTGGCPLISDVSGASKKLCIEAIGSSGGADSTERKLTSQQGGDTANPICQVL